MVVIPAIDILGGRCVRLTQGKYEQPTVYAEDPVTMAQRFAAAGAQLIHVVDLDAARGSASNRTVIAQMHEQSKVEMQVAGGVRIEDAVKSLVDSRAECVVMPVTVAGERRVF